MQVTSRKITSNGEALTILELLAKLPSKDQLEIHYQLSQWLKVAHRRTTPLADGQLKNAAFFQGELGQYILEEANDKISIDKVRKGLATITGSLAHAIIEDREER